MKTPFRILSSIGLIAACALAQTAQAQSGVTIKLPRPVQSMPGYVELNQSPTAGGPYLPQISQWCSDITMILGEHLANASMSMQMGDLATAKRILDRALQEASASIQLNPNMREPLTKILVDRGIALSHALDRSMGNSQRELMAKVNFLSGFVEFVIQKSSEMDSQYYIPYYYQYGACGGHCPADFNFAGFQERFIEYGRDLLQFTYERLTIVTHNGVFPSGDPRAFLKVAELVTGYVAQDISMTLGAYANACVIRELKRLSWRIATFNRGHGGYPNYPLAVAMVRQEMEYAAASLTAGSCGR